MNVTFNHVENFGEGWRGPPLLHQDRRGGRRADRPAEGRRPHRRQGDDDQLRADGGVDADRARAGRGGEGRRLHRAEGGGPGPRGGHRLQARRLIAGETAPDT